MATLTRRNKLLTDTFEGAAPRIYRDLSAKMDFTDKKEQRHMNAELKTPTGTRQWYSFRKRAKEGEEQ